jgi:hypothetical protein
VQGRAQEEEGDQIFGNPPDPVRSCHCPCRQRLPCRPRPCPR